MMTNQCDRLWKNWAAGQAITSTDLQHLVLWELEDKGRSLVFDISPANAFDKIKQRSYLWKSVYPTLYQFCQNVQLPEQIILETLWKLWLPLGLKLAAERLKLNRPLIQGILGLQGTGKTTLGFILTLILHHLGYKTVTISLDDLYKTYAERQRLQAKDPRIVWRGPPGTHDIELGITILEQLHYSKQVVNIPRFDKSRWQGQGDRIQPEVVKDINIVLFEGWFVGVRPINDNSFDTLLPPMQTAGDRQFARDMNQQLKAYLPLWERLDKLLILYPTDYRLSKQWRQQAERQAIASGKSGMTDAEVNTFVDYFWRSLHPELFVKPLLENPNLVDIAIEINSDRIVRKIYRPTNSLRE